MSSTPAPASSVMSAIPARSSSAPAPATGSTEPPPSVRSGPSRCAAANSRSSCSSWSQSRSFQLPVTSSQPLNRRFRQAVGYWKLATGNWLLLERIIQPDHRRELVLEAAVSHRHEQLGGDEQVAARVVADAGGADDEAQVAGAAGELLEGAEAEGSGRRGERELPRHRHQAAEIAQRTPEDVGRHRHPIAERHIESGGV